MGILSNFFKTNTENRRSDITQINDKNWIVNGEFVSFDEDTDLLRFKQEMEDNKHYNNYELERLSRDRQQIFNDWQKTKQAVRQIPDLANCVTEKKLEAITEKYDKYSYKCAKLNQTMFLTKEEFLIKEENILLCMDLFILYIPKSFAFYEIHNEKTARYRGGNMREIMAEEFKAKWY